MPQSPPENGAICPICGKPQKREFRPFCSSRCAQIDLGRWLKGSYVIPGERTKDVPDKNGGEEDDAQG